MAQGKNRQEFIILGGIEGTFTQLRFSDAGCLVESAPETMGVHDPSFQESLDALGTEARNIRRAAESSG